MTVRGACRRLTSESAILCVAGVLVQYVIPQDFVDDTCLKSNSQYNLARGHKRS